MSGRSSRRKGKAGELEVARIFREHGFDVYRTPNSGGLHQPGDVQGLAGYVFEVKRQETLALPAWLRQAHAACEAGEVPVVIFRRSALRTGRDRPPDASWHVVLPFKAFLELLGQDVKRQ